MDGAVYAALESTGLFDRMDADTDEAEHSLELQLCFIAHLMRCERVARGAAHGGAGCSG